MTFLEELVRRLLQYYAPGGQLQAPPEQEPGGTMEWIPFLHPHIAGKRVQKYTPADSMWQAVENSRGYRTMQLVPRQPGQGAVADSVLEYTPRVLPPSTARWIAQQQDQYRREFDIISQRNKALAAAARQAEFK